MLLKGRAFYHKARAGSAKSRPTPAYASRLVSPVPHTFLQATKYGTSLTRLVGIRTKTVRHKATWLALRRRWRTLQQILRLCLLRQPSKKTRTKKKRVHVAIDRFWQLLISTRTGSETMADVNHAAPTVRPCATRRIATRKTSIPGGHHSRALREAPVHVRHKPERTTVPTYSWNHTQTTRSAKTATNPDDDELLCICTWIYFVFFLDGVVAPFLIVLALPAVLANAASSMPPIDNANPMRLMRIAINNTLLKLFTSISISPAVTTAHTTYFQVFHTDKSNEGDTHLRGLGEACCGHYNKTRTRRGVFCATAEASLYTRTFSTNAGERRRQERADTFCAEKGQSVSLDWEPSPVSYFRNPTRR